MTPAETAKSLAAKLRRIRDNNSGSPRVIVSTEIFDEAIAALESSESLTGLKEAVEAEIRQWESVRTTNPAAAATIHALEWVKKLIEEREQASK